MSFPRYPKYKDSGVEWLGQVPEHWEVQPCRAIVHERTTKNGDGSCTDYLSLMANVGIIPYEEKGDVGNKKPDDLTKCKIVRRGDFVINSMNYGIGSYGASGYDGVCSPVYIVMTPQNDVVESGFAFRIFENRAFQTYAQSFGNGILEHRCAINWDILKPIAVGVPPKEEQRAILAFLDRETGKIDALVAEQQRLMELLKEKRQAVISHAVTKGLNPNAPLRPSGIEWLGDVPAHWQVCPVGYRYEVQLGKMLDSAKITGKHLRPYLRVFDVQWGEINTNELPVMDFDEDAQAKFRLQVGDLLVNEGGSYPGRAAIWRGTIEECYYQKALHRMRARNTKEDAIEFFYYLMFWAANQGVFTAGGNEATIEHLPAEKLRRYRFPFPPISEQQSITRFLQTETAKLDTLTAEAQRAIELLQERRTALISAAVTGQIDVRNAPGAPVSQPA
jgi:type I restriction enzyme S subunit